MKSEENKFRKLWLELLLVLLCVSKELSFSVAKNQKTKT